MRAWLSMCTPAPGGQGDGGQPSGVAAHLDGTARSAFGRPARRALGSRRCGDRRLSGRAAHAVAGGRSTWRCAVRITRKLGLLVTVPLVAVVAFAGLALVTTAGQALRADRLRTLVAVAAVGGDLAHRLQAERAAAVVLLTGGPAAGPSNAFLEAIAATDESTGRYRQARSEVSSVPAGAAVLRRAGAAALAGVVGARADRRRGAGGPAAGGCRCTYPTRWDPRCRPWPLARGDGRSYRPDSAGRGAYRHADPVRGNRASGHRVAMVGGRGRHGRGDRGRRAATGRRAGPPDQPRAAPAA